MHSKPLEISKKAPKQIKKAKAEGKKIVQSGTTTVRTLKKEYQKSACINPFHDLSELFIIRRTNLRL